MICFPLFKNPNEAQCALPGGLIVVVILLQRGLK